MKSFGRLLRLMRGTTPRAEIAARAQVDAAYLEALETGRVTADEQVAHHLLRHGFQLDPDEARRAVLGIQLFDLGLKDNELRQLVLDVILNTVPDAIRQQLHTLYQSYN